MQDTPQPAFSRPRQEMLPDQFDDYIWFEQTAAVKPFATKELEEMPDTYPFGV
jgi:erythromycin esterase-like protein